MADKTVETAAPKRGMSLRMVMVIFAILLMEAVVIVGAMMYLGSGPSDASALDVPEPQLANEGEKIVELEVLDAQMPNNKSGITYIYDTEVYAQVRLRNQSAVQMEIEQFQNEIKAEINAIWRSAEPHHFQEPKLETLTRKVYALLSERFGVDTEFQEPVISKVVIVMSTGFRVDI